MLYIYILYALYDICTDMYIESVFYFCMQGSIFTCYMFMQHLYMYCMYLIRIWVCVCVHVLKNARMYCIIAEAGNVSLGLQLVILSDLLVLYFYKPSCCMISCYAD